jgi:signal peptidase I
MEPTLIGGQHIWVDRVLYRLTDGPHRGDIVVFQSWDQDTPFVKRVVGLPGETVEFRGGDVVIDGEIVDEPYLTVPTDGPAGPFSLAGDELFVMGDNRSRSGDSRLYGPLREDDLIGRAWLRYWPPDKIGLLSGATRPLFASDP